MKSNLILVSIICVLVLTIACSVLFIISNESSMPGKERNDIPNGSNSSAGITSSDRGVLESDGGKTIEQKIIEKQAEIMSKPASQLDADDFKFLMNPKAAVAENLKN